MDFDFTIEGVPVEEWVKEQPCSETREVHKEAQKIPRYSKPYKKYEVKEKNGKVKHLTKEEIMTEYGMESIRKLTQHEQILFALYSADHVHWKTSEEVYYKIKNLKKGDTELDPAMIREKFSKMWGKAKDKNILKRTRIGKQYVHNLTNYAYSLPFDELVQVYKEKSDTAKGESVPCVEKTEEGESITSTLEEAKPMIPENININLNLNLNVHVSFGFSSS